MDSPNIKDVLSRQRQAEDADISTLGKSNGGPLPECTDPANSLPSWLQEQRRQEDAQISTSGKANGRKEGEKS